MTTTTTLTTITVTEYKYDYGEGFRMPSTDSTGEPTEFTLGRILKTVTRDHREGLKSVSFECWTDTGGKLADSWLHHHTKLALVKECSRLDTVEPEPERWSAGFNIPGFLPETAPELFDTEEEGRRHCRHEAGVVLDRSHEFEEVDQFAWSTWAGVINAEPNPNDWPVDPDGVKFWVEPMSVTS